MTNNSPTIRTWPPIFLSGISFMDSPENAARDPVIIERRNLVNISKLIVKELMDTSVKYGRMLDSDHMTLQHFFIVLEHVIRHGIKPKKGLLGPKKELWDILQIVEKLLPDAHEMTSSVRELPTVKTHMGRARAWLRLALMQKKLADYLQILIENRDDVLTEYFEQDALMMSEEAIVIVGLLVGLNVIDCNLCIKGEDLDCELGVIDFSLYLRSSHETMTHNHSGSDSPNEIDNMTTVLDQKNYIEELNRHLNATVGNLQANVESLTTTNALMKEDLDIARNNIIALMQENAILKAQRCHSQNMGNIAQKHRKNKNPKELLEDGFDFEHLDDDGKQILDYKIMLEKEQKLRQEAEKELNLQICLKAEMEVAMKLLEKDIHEKQDTIISLRKQLEDIKLINLEMYKKLQECESSLKHKTELITQLECKSAAAVEKLDKIDKEYRQLEKEKNTFEDSLQTGKEEFTQCIGKLSVLDGEIKVEREWRESLQSTLIEERKQLSELKEENAQLKAISNRYVTLQEEHHKLKEENKEQERALEEIGDHLRLSKLQLSDLKEETSSRRHSNVSQWTSDKNATNCKSCFKEFNLTTRKHHCRNCGEIFCKACSDNTMPLASSAKPVRVCDECNKILMERFSVLPPK